MTLLLGIVLLFQAGVRNDLAELREYLGTTYPGLIQRLDAKNQILLRNTERLAPAQAAEMRARMQMPPRLPADRPIIAARIDNAGQGLLSFVFEDDFITEQINFIFCPAQTQPPVPERLMAIQMLLDDSRVVGTTANLLHNVYQLPPPLPPTAAYELTLLYPIRPNVPMSVWYFGTVEGLYQPVPGQKLVTAQFWLTDTTVVSQCAAPPRLPAPTTP